MLYLKQSLNNYWKMILLYWFCRQIFIIIVGEMWCCCCNISGSVNTKALSSKCPSKSYRFYNFNQNLIVLDSCSFWLFNDHVILIFDGASEILLQEAYDLSRWVCVNEQKLVLRSRRDSPLITLMICSFPSLD